MFFFSFKPEVSYNKREKNHYCDKCYKNSVADYFLFFNFFFCYSLFLILFSFNSGFLFFISSSVFECSHLTEKSVVTYGIFHGSVLKIIFIGTVKQFFLIINLP